MKKIMTIREIENKLNAEILDRMSCLSFNDEEFEDSMNEKVSIDECGSIRHIDEFCNDTITNITTDEFKKL